jgi:CRISPR-associated endoribonuclease Cas6
VITFEFHRFRFYFRALDAFRFAPGGSANAVRGALGAALRSGEYAWLFAPPAGSPSGLADSPRPFVLRTWHLDGVPITPGDPFHFDLHLFEVSTPLLGAFQEAFATFAKTGFGKPRTRAELLRTAQLGLADEESPGPPLVLSLDPEPTPVRNITLRFVTPTELKGNGALAASPGFPVLFARLRDRIGTLRALYGPGPLEIDFRGLGERAAAVRLVRSELAWTGPKRKSASTGQIHSIGGFTGEAEYEGPLAEFLPWLRAARWVGIGRQTVWGKGDVRLVIP